MQAQDAANLIQKLPEFTCDRHKSFWAGLLAGRSGIGPSRMALLWTLRDSPTEVAYDRIAVQGHLLDQDLARLEAEIFQEKIDPSLTLDTTAGPTYVSAQIGRALDVEAT